MECFARSFASAFRCGYSCNVTNHFGVVTGHSGHDTEIPSCIGRMFCSSWRYCGYGGYAEGDLIVYLVR